jgi:hypothetical protein
MTLASGHQDQHHIEQADDGALATAAQPEQADVRPNSTMVYPSSQRLRTRS